MRSIAMGLVLLVLLAVTGCSTPASKDDPVPDYTPVPDQDLFAQVDDVPGVESADLKFSDDFPDKKYVGRVVVRQDADAEQTLDTVYAILRQGQPDTAIAINASQGGKGVRFEVVPGSAVGSPTNLTRRYGPQPGDGKPPTG